MKTAEYEPFGHEWQKEMNKFSKAELITMLKVRIMTATKWIPVEEFEGEIGQMVLVKGILITDLDDSNEPSIGFVNWKSKEHSACSDCCYYSMWYTDITEVFIIPKTV